LKNEICVEPRNMDSWAGREYTDEEALALSVMATDISRKAPVAALLSGVQKIRWQSWLARST